MKTPIIKSSYSFPGSSLGPQTAFLAIASCLFAYPIFRFAYNAGYGYDSLEYLIIGRGLTEDVPLYTYAPSKSPGIYYFVWILMKCGVSFWHTSLSIVITLLNLAVMWCAYFVFRAWSNASNAFLLAILVIIATQFTELNFLQPEALVAMMGLIAWHFLNDFLASNRPRSLVLAGLCIGVGALFKSVALFYALASVIAILFWKRNVICRELGKNTLMLGCFSASVALPIIVAGVIYWLDGRFASFWEYTITFPLFKYPATTTYVAKLYTKLLWIHVVVISSLLFLFKKDARHELSSNHATLSAAVFGGCSYIALFKTQASHYAFPGIPFLLFFATRMISTQSSLMPKLKGSAYAAAAALAGLVIISGLLYRPDVLQRFFQMRDFQSEEREQRKLIEGIVPLGKYILMTSAWITMKTYWTAHRYPPPPYINMDVKTIWMLRNHPDAFLRVIDNKNLYVVEFNDSQLTNPELEDVFGERPEDAHLVAIVYDKIKSGFTPLVRDASGNTYWVRK